MIGPKIGPFDVVALLGEGGMGEVYRARDTRLKREVAIKVLPVDVARDPERLARARREAEILAALSHPHIAAIHGLEESDGHLALVLELVEGPTLAEMIAQSGRSEDRPLHASAGAAGLSLADALPIARQLADALDYAHERGIVHRDLKPANIKVRADGVVKVLDFGLAKGFGPGAAGVTDQASASALTSPALTAFGLVLGTAAYMSPEQARGRPVDKRADLWSFGCVLYEMLTGRRPFAGDDVAETMGAVIHKEPDWTALPSATPPSIRRLLRRCLVKDPKARIADASTARIEIDEAVAEDSAPPAERPDEGGADRGRARLQGRVAMTIVAAAGLLAGGLATFAALTFRRGPDPAVIRFDVPAPSGTRFDPGRAKVALVSPNGRMLVFAAVGADGISRLWVQSLDSSTARLLAFTDGAFGPFWSPNSRQIAFFAAGKLQQVDATGGTPQVIDDFGTTAFAGGTWSSDGRIVYGPPLSGLVVSAGPGAASTSVTTLDADRREVAHTQPRFLPDGRHFLFLASSSEPGKSAIFVGDADTQTRTFVMNSETEAAYVPQGYLLFLRGTTLMARRFDPDTFQFSGDAIQLADGLGLGGANSAAFSASDNGILVHRSRGGDDTRVVWFSREGEQTPLTDLPSGPYGHIELSPDERRIAILSGTTGTGDILLHDLARGIPSKFTFDPAFDTTPRWSSSGSDVVFMSARNPPGIYRKASDGTGQETLVLGLDPTARVSDWSSDGRLLYTVRSGTSFDLWLLGPNGGKPEAFLETRYTEREGRFSPDGRWIAYSSDQSGRHEVYVRPSTPGGPEVRISKDGGSQPRWRHDGGELFYLDPIGRMFAVSLQEKGGVIVPGRAMPLFATGSSLTMAPPGQAGRGEYAVTRDGRRFLMITRVQDPSADPAHVVLNWPSLIRK